MSEQAERENLMSRRIARLEGQIRGLKRAALAFLVVITFIGTCIGLMGQTQKRRTPASAAAPAAPPPAPPAPKNFEGESFILKDSSGRVRAELSMSGTGPSLKLRDETGSALVTLALNDGTPGGPVLLLSDPKHRASLAMSVLADAGSQLSLTGERADVQLHMGVTPDGTILELSDKDGFTTSIGSGPVVKNGQVKKTTAASVVLFGKERKLLWSAP